MGKSSPFKKSPGKFSDTHLFHTVFDLNPDIAPMQVSVIIPVYNAARFLSDAVASAVTQPPVKEIILVDDGSNDNSLAICQTLAQKHTHVHVYQHAGKRNCGPAATRNLGIKKAQCPFIAFLDADDVYLQQRFEETWKTFEQHPDADGVYETVVTTAFADKPQPVDPRAGKITAGFSRMIAPEELFSVLALAKEGYIHLDGLVLRKAALDASSLFDTALRQCEDTDLLLRLAASKKLHRGPSGRIVAHRRVHDMNTVFDTTSSRRYRYLCMRKCATNEFYGSKDKRANREILNRMARSTPVITLMKRLHLPVTPFRLVIIGLFLCRHPRVLRKI